MIFTICANPLLDTVYWNRHSDEAGRLFFLNATISGGGFGPNAARALASRSQAATCVITAGGLSGRHLVESLEGEGRSVEFEPIRESTRVATHRLDGAASQMLVSPSPTIGPDALERLFALALSDSNPSDLILVGGSVSPDVEATYLRCIRDLCRQRTTAVDVRTPGWSSIASAGPAFIRVAGGREACVAALAAGARCALATVGTDVHVETEELALRLSVPELRPVNPFGAGDCLIAIMSHLLHAHESTEVAATKAAACAAASVLDPIPGQFRWQEADAIEVSIHVDVKQK